MRDAAVDVVSTKDSNSDEDKHNIGVIQAFSELADGIASSKGIELKKTIPDEIVVWYGFKSTCIHRFICSTLDLCI